MRLIDADALLNCIPYEDVISRMAVANAPTIEPERKRGEWIHDGYDFPHGVDWMHCSVCGKRDVYCPASLTNYCPNCGSQMSEDKGG